MCLGGSMDGTNARPLTSGEETANIVSHGIGLVLAIVALVMLVVKASVGGDPWRIVAMSVYGSTLVLLFAASTLYHSAREPRLRRLLRILDHSSIYLLIAGTYTPFTLVTLRGPWGWSLFGIVWGMAAAGIFYKAYWLGRNAWVSTALYVAMGWLGLVAAGPIISTLDPAGLAWLLGGGLLYTGGVVFFLWERLPFHHLIWHLFVLGGAICHFIAVLLYVLPR